MKKTAINILGVLAGLVLINFISGKVYKRYDLTEDKRYTLSESSKALVRELEAPIIIDMFLEGDFPSEFRLLRSVYEEFGLIEPNELK